MGSSPIRVATLHSFASVAQSVEQRTENPRVVGSIPTGGTSGNIPPWSRFYADLAHLVERDLAKVEVAGSSPVIRSTWKLSSAGRASALQAEGHRFEPYCSHHDGPVAQLVRAPACHAGGRGFEPHPGRHLHASVAQLVEQRTENPRVVGSIPTGGTNNQKVLERLPPFQGNLRV